MRMKIGFFLALAFVLSACSHSRPDPAAEAAEISHFSKADAQAELARIAQEEAALDEGLRNAEARRDQYRLRASENASKDDAVEGAEAQLESLRARRAALAHRRHLVEGRLRNLEPTPKTE